MPGALTAITEITTALGTVAPDLPTALACGRSRLRNVPGPVWEALVAAHATGAHAESFRTAFGNGAALLHAEDGLRGRPPRLVEWKGPHRPPGDDVIPVDIRIDHVYQVSCKYLSRITLNAGPARLFDRLLVGEERRVADWFAVVAPDEYQRFYGAVRQEVAGALPGALPVDVADVTASDRALLKRALRPRALPASTREGWSALCRAVSEGSADRWRERLADGRVALRLLWRMLRIGHSPYFVLGTDRRSHIRLRIASTWDWLQAFELSGFTVCARDAGQPEVGWHAAVRDRATGAARDVHGHVEIRWSHGRFQGAPEAKVYLDTPHSQVPGYHPLV